MSTVCFHNCCGLRDENDNAYLGFLFHYSFCPIHRSSSRHRNPTQACRKGIHSQQTSHCHDMIGQTFSSYYFSPIKSISTSSSWALSAQVFFMCLVFVFNSDWFSWLWAYALIGQQRKTLVPWAVIGSLLFRWIFQYVLWVVKQSWLRSLVWGTTRGSWETRYLCVTWVVPKYRTNRSCRFPNRFVSPLQSLRPITRGKNTPL